MWHKISEFVDRHFALIVLSPFVIAIAAACVIPVVMVLRESFFIDRPGQFQFAGLGNYAKIFTSSAFYADFLRTIEYSGLSSLLSFLIGLGLALALNQNIRGRRFFRVWVLYPWAVPPVVAGFMFKWFFNEVYGAGNDLLIKMGVEPVNWLSNPKIAMGVLIGCDTWIRIPFVTIILLAGLQTVPMELYEAAKIDGASAIRLFRHITLPYLVAPIRVAMLVVTVFSFRVIDMMMVLTGGGPGRATHLFAAYIYKQGFRFLRFGHSAAAGVVMILATLLIVAAYTYLLRPKVEVSK
ncbi:MAG: carbohydrate ABC transporter permease [bacterium]